MPEEYTTYKTQGYPMSATVGKDGAELAFEKYLHGTNGTAIVTKNAAGTAAGLTGFFGYFLGTFILANTVIGWVAQQFGWGWTFMLLVGACILAILFMGLTLKEERHA